jgi:AraC-like DNA-binding protein
MRNSNLFQEITPLSVEDCFIIFDRKKRNFNYPVHVHPDYELNFIENAQGSQRIVGDSIEEIGNFDLCLIGNPELEHGWMNHNNNPENEIHEITIQFQPDLFLDSLLSKRQFYSVNILFENAKNGVAFSQNAISKIHKRIKLLSSENSDFESVIELISILHELSLDKEYRILSTNSYVETGFSSESKRVQKVLNYLQLHCREDVHLNDVAAHIGMSSASFSRFLKKRSGKNFVEYLNDLRLGYATHDLVNTNNPISEICYSCGYNNISNFNRIFKQRKGVTPKEFRETYGKMRKLI